MPSEQQLLPFTRAIPSVASRTSSPLSQLSSEGQESQMVAANAEVPRLSSKSKPRTSWIFHHMPDKDPETVYKNSITSKEEWRCRYCPKTYALSGGTAAPTAHLIDPISKKGHGLAKNSPRETKAKNQQSTIENAIATAESQNFKRRKLNHEPGDTINPGILEVLYVQFLVACSLPFRLVECPEFRAFLYYLNNEIDNWLPSTHEHIRTWLEVVVWHTRLGIS